MKAFGTRPTYQIFAVISLVTGLIYFFFNALYLKKRPQVEGNDIVKKKPKTRMTGNQNGGLDRGGIVEIPLDDEKERQRQVKEIEKKSIEDGLGIENENFVKEKDDYDDDNGEVSQIKDTKDTKDTKDLESIRNAKNLERVEKSTISTKGQEKIEVQNGSVNPNFIEDEKDEERDVTIEIRPDI